MKDGRSCERLGSRLSIQAHRKWKLSSWLVPLKKLTSILGTYLCPLFISIRRSVDSCLQRAGRLAMFHMAVYDSITELFKQALLVHHVMVLEPLGSLTTAEAIGDLVREGQILAAGYVPRSFRLRCLTSISLETFHICLHLDYHDRTSDGHKDFSYAAKVFQDLREAILHISTLEL